MAGKRLGLDHPTEVGALWARWNEIVGPQIALHAEPSSLRAGLLRVRTDSTVWATEISYLGEEIKRRANAALGRDVVVDVRVWTGPGPLRARAPAAARTPSKTTPAGELPDDPADALERARRAWLRRRIS
jgi:predicted nucleic acid-binding Zn ribbon protein